MKHTPAPWKIDELNSLSIIDNSGNRIDQLICQTNGKSREEAQANAKLIASAPELLEALEAITIAVKMEGLNSTAWGNLLITCQSAINKATI